MGTRSTPQIVALIAAGAVVIGSLGPWETTFIADIAGTQGDGRFTLGLAVLAGALILLARPGSNWLLLAGIFAGISGAIGIIDLINVNNATQTLFGNAVKLISPGWGLWVTAIASTILTIAIVALWIEPQDEENPAPSEETG